MATTLLEAARRLGIDTNTNNGKAQGETSAPEALTPEQLEEGKSGYEKYLNDAEGVGDLPAWAIPYEGDIVRSRAKEQAFVKRRREEQDRYMKVDDVLYLIPNSDLGMFKPSDDWTEDERNEFGYIYATEGWDKAKQFAVTVNDKSRRKENEKIKKAISDFSTQNVGTAAISSIASVFSAPMAIADYGKQLVESVKYGRPVSQEASLFTAGQTAREAIGTKLNEYGTIDDNVFMLGGKGWGDVYGWGMSIADSNASAAAFGKVGTLVNFFGQSASRAYEEAYKRGATTGQATLYSVLMGAAEAIPEMISADALLGIGKEATKSLFKQVLKQAGEEAGEEATTSILELVIDKIVFGENNIDILAKQYEASGMSRDEAIKKAWIDSVGEVLYSAVSGFASGGVSGSGAAYLSTTNLNADNKAAKEQLTPMQSQMFEEGKTVNDAASRKTIDRLAQRTESGKELSGYQLRQLSSAVTEGRNADTTEKVRLAIANRLMAKGVDAKSIPALTDIVLNKALGQNLTKAQQIRLKNSEAATIIANELDMNNMLSGNFDSQWAIDAGINQIRDVSGAIMQALSDAYEQDAGANETKTDADVTPIAFNKGTGISGTGGYAPQSANSRMHTHEISHITLDAKQTAQIRAMERVANALGVDFYVYESEYNKKTGKREYVRRDNGEVISDNGYYNPNDKSVHIDLHAGATGKGTMLFTASHELVHWVKDSSEAQYNALKDFVLSVLGKKGVQLDTLIEKQIEAARSEKRDMDRDGAIEEIIADACMSVLSTDAGIKAVTNLKTENRGLWNTLKRFFTNFFNRIDKMYKGVKVDSEEGQYLADMHEEAKRLRDLFAEAVSAASEANAKAQNTSTDLAQIDTASDYKAKKETKASPRKKGGSVDLYSEKEYNDFGWARANDLLSADENAKLRSLFADADKRDHKFRKTKSGEYMIPIGDAIEDKIAFMTGTIDEPILNRVIVIDAYGNDLDKARRYVYDFERRGVQQKTGGVFRLYYAIDFGSYAEYKGNFEKNQRDSVQLGADRGAGSSGTQEVESRVRNSLAPIAQTFKDITGKSRNVRRIDGQYAVEGTTKINYLYDTVEAAIEAENAHLIEKYSRKSGRTISWVKAQIKANPEFLHNKIKSSTRKRITPEMDASYLDAVNRGDTETAQRLVDEAAWEAGYRTYSTKEGSPSRVLHGTQAKFTVFSHDAKTVHGKYFGKGFYFTDSENAAEFFAGKNLTYYNPETGEFDLKKEAYVMGVYLDMGKCISVNAQDFKNMGELRRAVYKAFDNDADCDGVVVYNVKDGTDDLSTVYVVKNANQVKSADPITYDDSGNVIPLSERFNSAQSDIRYSPRKKRTVTLSVGEEAKFRANYTRAKVFSKSNMHRIIEKFIGKGELTAKTIEELADDMWISFNTATSVEERREFAHSAAEFVVAKLLQERKVESAESKAAAEQLLYLKSGIRRIEFTEQEIEEIRHKKDESGLKSIRARWGYQKSRTNDRVLPYPMDVFVTDVAREIPGMEHLADMNHIDAFFEIIEHYDSLKKTAADKWVSAYLETSDSDLESLQMEIEQTIFEAYETEGEESKFSKFVSAKIGAFQERALFWKAEHDNLKGRSRFENLIVDKARKFEELKKGTFLNATQYKADAFKDSIEKLSTLKFRGNIRKPNAVRDIFKPILEWYNKENPMLVDPNAEDGTPHKYSYEVAAMLEVIANGKDGLSNDELAAICEVMNYFTKFIETYNKIWRNGKWIDAADVAQTDIEILKFVATSRSAKGIRRALDTYLENFAEPMAYARMVDGYQNGFYTQTMTELREASIKAALEEMNIRAEYDQFLADHKDYVKTASTELVDFKGIKIPKMELIGLYMTYKRKHAQAGLIFNGFQFERRISKYTNETETISLPGAANPNAKLSQEEFDNLVNMEMKLISTKLSATDKAYIELLEKLYNGKLRDLKVRRDMDRLGFTNATLDYYYPIRRATIAKSIDAAVFDDVNRATNSSFNKNTVKGARQKLRIDSADALINRHIHEICNYAYMSGAIENYNTVFNIDISGNPNDPVSVRTTVEATNIWKKSQQYFRKLVKDMQGIGEEQSVIEDTINRLRSGYVRFALGLNLKTIFTQASSVFAATDVLDYSSIVKGMHLDSTGVDDYCPYAKLRNYDQSAIKALSVSDKVDKSLDWMTKGISFMDRVIICRLFGACQVQAEKNGAGAVGTEANKIAAGKLLEKVILDTQANSLATERSAAMRNKHEIIKSLVMFTADSMKIASRVLDAAGELKMLSENGASEAEIKRAKVKLVKSVITVVNIAVYMACIAQLFRWIYNRDEDEEKVPLTMAIDFIGNLFAGMPIVSDIADFFLNGYEVENVALDAVTTVATGIKDLATDCYNVAFNRDEAPSKQKWHRDTRTFIYGVAQIVGVPFRNVYNLISGIVGNFSEKAEYYIDDFFYENNYYSDLEEALQEENSGKVDLLLSLSYGKPFGEGVTDATVTELNRLARVDKKYLALPKTVPDKITRDGIEYTLTDNQKQQILTEYSKVNAAIDKLVNSASYQKLSDDKKAERLKYYYNEYFNSAVTKVLKLVKSNAEVLQGAIGFDTYAKFHFATKGIKSDTGKNGNTISGSKRKKVIAAIDKLNLTEEKRLLLIASKGYSLSESERTKLIRYINSLKLTESSKKALAEMCGFEVKNGKIVYK